MAKVKFLFLGIDGLDYDLVHKYECQFLLWLMQTNQHGVLVSNDVSGCNRRGEPLTGPAWTTIYTGIPASAHGLTADVWLRGPHHTLAPFIWEILEERHTLGLLALPGYRPKGTVPPLNGWMIRGFEARGEVKPSDIYPQLEIPKWFRLEECSPSVPPDKRVADFYELQQRQVDDKLRLLKKLPRMEIMAVGVQMVDWMCHCHIDRRAGYEFIDNWIMRVIAEVVPENFLICSDHGFQEHEGRHSQRGIYIASLPWGEIPRTIYDMAPMTLFLTERR